LTGRREEVSLPLVTGIRNITLDDFARLWAMDWQPLVKERDSIYLEICQQQRDLCFVAEEPGGAWAGAVLAGRGSGSAFVYQLWVEPQLRGRGIGTELLRAVERAAGAAGLRYVWLFTTTAAGFYERLGYRRDSSIFSGSALEHVVERKKAEVMVKRL